MNSNSIIFSLLFVLCMLFTTLQCFSDYSIAYSAPFVPMPAA
mgnify:CR=1 FL=1